MWMRGVGLSDKKGEAAFDVSSGIVIVTYYLFMGKK